jgi:uncharacterized protein with PQ loop repeat
MTQGEAWSDFLGYSGTAVVLAAYLPQIIHLLKEHCSAGISVRAYSLWLLSSMLFLVYAAMIQDMVFILVQVVNLIAMSVIVFLAVRFRSQLCSKHLMTHLEHAGEEATQAAANVLRAPRPPTS